MRLVSVVGGSDPNRVLYSVVYSVKPSVVGDVTYTVVPSVEVTRVTGKPVVVRSVPAGPAVS